MASLATYPHEVIRARLQDQRSAPAPAPAGAGAGAGAPAPSGPRYRGIVDCARTVFREEGLRGLYSGFSANLARALPATAIMFFVYESVLRAVQGSGVLGPAAASSGASEVGQ